MDFLEGSGEDVQVYSDDLSVAASQMQENSRDRRE